jgi:hypothetical protein
MNPRLFPFADFDFNDLAMEKGHEKPKQHNIKNSNIPITNLHKTAICLRHCHNRSAHQQKSTSINVVH